jgi:hypothetical protein
MTYGGLEHPFYELGRHKSCHQNYYHPHKMGYALLKHLNIERLIV